MLRSLAFEGAAVLRRPLPVLLGDASLAENQRALAADRLAAARAEGHARSYPHPAARADAYADRGRGPGARAHALGHPGVDVAAVGELGAARGRAPGAHHLVVGGAVPAALGAGGLARRCAAGEKKEKDLCGDFHDSLNSLLDGRIIRSPRSEET